jgi:hypothetical protein
MTGKVIQGSFLTDQPRWSSLVHPKFAPSWIQAKTVAPPPTAFARARTGPAQAFAVRPHGAPPPVIAPKPAGLPVRARAAQPTALQREGVRGAFAVEPAPLGLVSTGGRPLPEAVRGKMEAALGADFTGVRVHVGPQAERIGAIAFTTGNDIYFAPGRYQPNTIQGQQLLGHELTHVVQQRAGRVRNPLGTGLAVVQDRALEAEADRLGRLAATAPRTEPWRPNPMMKASRASFPRSRPAIATAMRYAAPTAIQGRLVLNGNNATAVDLAQHAYSIHSNNSVWDHAFARRLKALEDNVHRVEFTWTAVAPPGAGAPGHYTVSVKGRQIVGQFNRLGPAVAAAQDEVDQAFVSLADDERSRRYGITRDTDDKIRGRAAEKDFKKTYRGQTTLEDAVEAAIAAMGSAGTSKVKYSRLDLQTEARGIKNFQVQLGGSEDFRRGMGDSSSTIVIIPVDLFDRESAGDPERWVEVMKAAHRESFMNRRRLTFE